ncbi:tripartite tricarboxylate transporter TctB family protein [Tianweitania sediminis]|uniref:Tripartite tricarboxylate transporter TctB family protein n=1 Tax=Tianweitania sediminis TaxID=1502156 RepID=A0A8J7RF94_9HYPH|nr:tripartite tricarboxylate transporter TctB family protein [Tianweitania sediminis]MBP0437366.1 tripartite tricarboxylate transporter TctB family protein [Tianweitania sediminis]
MVRSDTLLGALAVIAGLALLWASYFIPTSGFVTTLSAQFFPRVLAGVMAILGLLLLARPRSNTLKNSLAPLATARFAGFVLATALYLITFPHTDFRLGTALFLLAGIMLMGARKPLELVLVPVLGALGMWIVFRFGFTILLPVWI